MGGTKRYIDKDMYVHSMYMKRINVAPLLMEGFGLMKSFRGIIQNQLLFEGFGIMKSFLGPK